MDSMPVCPAPMTMPMGRSLDRMVGQMGSSDGCECVPMVLMQMVMTQQMVGMRADTRGVEVFEDESVKVGPKKRGPKPRLRSAGMSRYRRKEANARERQRQGEINTSFDRLREKIPHPGPSNGKCEKLRKIDILRVSIMYIRLVRWLTVMMVPNKY